MPELPADFDLKLMPDWLKEPASKNPYADYEGRDEDRRPRGRDDWGGGRGRQEERRGKPGGGQRPGGQRDGGGGGRRDDRARKDAPAARKPDGRETKDGKRPDRPAGAGTDERRGRPGEQRRSDDRGGQERRSEPQTQPANVTIEFFPDESCSVSIARQVKSTHRAYSLFDLARMFLARPERHRLKITTKSVAEPLYQVGEDGPVWLDRASAERAAFPLLRPKFYIEVTEQRDMPKGNFSNVARYRANGILLGPTNYHGYQPALRKMFEERFSRRMSFPEFQREIEVVNDPALVEQWKQQASSVTMYRLAPPQSAEKPAAANAGKQDKTAPPEKPADGAGEGETPVETSIAGDAGPQAPGEAAAMNPEASTEEAANAETAPSAESAPAAETAPSAEAAPAAYDGPSFNTLAEVEQHFRQNYLPGVIRQASSVHLSGEASRTLTDRGIAAAVRQAWEQERGFPGQMMHQLRQQFSRSGLHVFKHRKRMQFVSLIRPSPMEDGSLSASVAEILQVIQGNLNCNRASLAAAVLGSDESAVDPARKATLAADLRWLIETGRVIEFSDGRLELPVAPAKNEPVKAEAPQVDHAASANAKPEETPAAHDMAPASEQGSAMPEMPAAPEPVAQTQIVTAVETATVALSPARPDCEAESEIPSAEPVAEASASAGQVQRASARQLEEARVHFRDLLLVQPWKRYREDRSSVNLEPVVHGIGMAPGGKLVILTGIPLTAVEASHPELLQKVAEMAISFGLSEEEIEWVHVGRNVPCVRPAGGGDPISTGPRETGSIACMVHDSAGNRFLLGCSHVLAAEPVPRIGIDEHWEPGSAAGGTSADRIGVLHDFVPIDLTGEFNYFDAALSRPDDPGWCQRGLQIRGPIAGINSSPAYNIPVHKVGWKKPRVTSGILRYLKLSHTLNFPSGVAIFDDQYAVVGQSASQMFAAAGDSGALVTDDQNQGIGVVFGMAQGANIAYVNPLEPILHHFKVTIT